MAFVFDDESRALLDELGLLPPDERDTLDVERLFARCGTQPLECLRACVAVFVTNEHVLHHPAGALLKKAAAAEGLEIVFDLPARGMTRALIEKLEAVPKQPSSVAAEPRLRFAYFDRHVDRSTFHSKVISFHLRSGARRVALTLLGSANFTIGGLRRNDELGVLVCREVDGTLDVRTGWRALDATLTRYARDATTVTTSTPLPRDADEQRRLQGRIEAFEPDAHLRDYQHQARDALVAAYRWSRAKAGPPGRGAMLALPPAAGKTLIALCAAMKLFEGKGAKPIELALWLSPTPDLARQAFEELDRYFLRRDDADVEALFFDGRLVRSLPGNHTWELTPDTIRELRSDESKGRRRFLFIGKDKLASSPALRQAIGGVDLLVADEAHHTIAPEWTQVIESLRPRTVFGLTATPYISKPTTEATKRLLNAYPLGTVEWQSYFSESRQEEVEGAAPKRGGGGKLAYARSAREFIQADRKLVESERVLAEPTFQKVQLLDESGVRLCITPRAGRGGLPPHRRLERALEQLDPDAPGSHAWRAVDLERHRADTARHRAEHLKDKVHDSSALAAALGGVDRDALEWARARIAEKKLVLLFARGTGHAGLLHRHARAIGIADTELEVVHSKDGVTPATRRHRVRRLRKRGAGLLICVDMLAEGTDLKEVSHMVITRWTTSERLFWQIVGRGLRGPGSGGTKDVTIRLYDIGFAQAAGDADDVAMLEQASAALIEELSDAGVEVCEETLLVQGARPRAPDEIAVKPRRAPSTAKRDARSDYSGAMTDEDIDRFLRGLPGGKYICWVETARTRKERTKQIECVSPHAKIQQFAKRHRGTGYRFHVVRVEN